MGKDYDAKIGTGGAGALTGLSANRAEDDVAPTAFLTKLGLSSNAAKIALRTDAGRDGIAILMQAAQGRNLAPVTAGDAMSLLRQSGEDGAEIEKRFSTPEGATSAMLSALGKRVLEGTPPYEFMQDKRATVLDTVSMLTSREGNLTVQVMMRQSAEPLRKPEAQAEKSTGWLKPIDIVRNWKL